MVNTHTQTHMYMNTAATDLTNSKTNPRKFILYITFINLETHIIQSIRVIPVKETNPTIKSN